MSAQRNAHPIRDRIATVLMFLLGRSTLGAFVNEALLVFYQKAGIAILLAFLFKGASGPLPSDPPSGVIAVDATLAAVTLISYVLTRGWRSWRA